MVQMYAEFIKAATIITNVFLIFKFCWNCFLTDPPSDIVLRFKTTYGKIVRFLQVFAILLNSNVGRIKLIDSFSFHLFYILHVTLWLLFTLKSHQKSPLFCLVCLRHMHANNWMMLYDKIYFSLILLQRLTKTKIHIKQKQTKIIC